MASAGIFACTDISSTTCSKQQIINMLCWIPKISTYKYWWQIEKVITPSEIKWRTTSGLKIIQVSEWSENEKEHPTSSKVSWIACLPDKKNMTARLVTNKRPRNLKSNQVGNRSLKNNALKWNEIIKRAQNCQKTLKFSRSLPLFSPLLQTTMV